MWCPFEKIFSIVLENKIWPQNRQSEDILRDLWTPPWSFAMFLSTLSEREEHWTNRLRDQFDAIHSLDVLVSLKNM